MNSLIATEHPAPAQPFFVSLEKMSLEKLFGNNNPVEVEIGCGKGKFLVTRAGAFPGTNFIGIDRAAKWMRIGQRRGERLSLENLKFMKSDVREILFRLPASSISMFHIYFPDPWPKKRHKRRRLISDSFLKILWNRLRPAGCVEIATDDKDYLEQIQESIEMTRPLWESVRRTVNQRLIQEDVKTNYELKFEAAGRDLYYIELKRKEIQ